MTLPEWKIFTGSGIPHDGIEGLPPPPPWRSFKGVIPPNWKAPTPEAELGWTFQADPEVIDLVNASLYLRRPLLVTGKPGTGKSSLIQAVAHELKLGPVLRWPVTSRSTVQQALYNYDAIGRLQDAQLCASSREEAPHIGDYLELGPLGTALLPSRRPRALLIDEIDKGDIDLPNDLLNILEEGEFHIPELARIKENKDIDVRVHGGEGTALIGHGIVRCNAFPFVVLTSNGEREFPAPFLRRCLHLTMRQPDERRLSAIVSAHLKSDLDKEARELIAVFAKRMESGSHATDQIMNALHLVGSGRLGDDRRRLEDMLTRDLTTAGPA